ncbi:hypothetical protein LC1917_0447 [Lacticaseibacillus paracasei NRIC 1917]|uniref:Uncharacterized protein n=1 Tax=Lacticaseibacillus paracasei NRIC 0644 TaxID=1435038 RepID=A0A0C9P0G1_LACPA|nr:hypothetical protein LC0644_2419 [Lacticaseibacillus paracasei NRIC 0644]GAN38570.1 hypothetical protein LC1917_0447 [Lacticaseibacillus paracasei NRIC 1917]
MNFFCHDGGPPYFSSTDAVMAFAERMLGGGGAYDGLESGFGLAFYNALAVAEAYA